MARLLTVPAHPKEDQPPILDAVKQLKQKCLLFDGSVFSNSPLWTISNFSILDEHFIKNPIVGDQPFLDKFRLQLISTSEAIKQLAAEMLWLLLLFPSNIGGSKKRHNIMQVWSWSGQI
jgi:5-methylcytosine-specific restriction protein B